MFLKVYYLEKDIFDEPETAVKECDTMSKAKYIALKHGPGSYIKLGNEVVCFVDQKGELVCVKL